MSGIDATSGLLATANLTRLDFTWNDAFNRGGKFLTCP